MLLVQLQEFMALPITCAKQYPDISFLHEDAVGSGVIDDALQTACRAIFIDHTELWEYSEFSGSFGPAAVPLQKDSRLSTIYEVRGQTRTRLQPLLISPLPPRQTCARLPLAARELPSYHGCVAPVPEGSREQACSRSASPTGASAVQDVCRELWGFKGGE
jgi:hypothetical protein